MKSKSEVSLSGIVQVVPTSTNSRRDPLVGVENWSGNGPLRAELYGLEALESHARELASAHLTPVRGGKDGRLLKRLKSNEQLLTLAVRRITESADRGARLSPDAEWLFDNYYVIEEVLREVRHDLPRSYYRELPKGHSGYPRVYALALALIAHTDSGLDEDHIVRFVQSWQSVTPLTIGEVWAVPTMLRLGLLENLRRLAEAMLSSWDERDRADEWVHVVRNEWEGDRTTLPPQAGDIFVVRALRALRDEGPPEAFERLKVELSVRGIDAAEVVRRENQHQAVDQVSVGNCVTSMRLLTALDWARFFERTNLIDPVLARDPAGVYESQDFATRDRYRQAVERLAKRSNVMEIQVANRAIELASRDRNTVRGHVGYYLVGAGARPLKAEIGYRPSIRERLRETALARPNLTFFGGLIAVTGILLAGLWVLFGAVGVDELWVRVVMLLMTVLPVSEVAVGLMNYLVILCLPPRVLPKLEFREGIPTDFATVVVMPSMLIRPQSAATLLEKLEIHYLANSDANLRFALLTDFADAQTETRPEDEAFVRSALDGVAVLNQRYSEGGPPKFFLFHRRRLWNPSQGCWMGWERKRGKLSEFNRLVRGDRTTSYNVSSTDPAELSGVRYVITLDADTQLPRDSARKLIGTLAHPLNQARFDATTGRVVEGYSILQPRVSIHIPAARKSRFSWVWALSAGIDPYSTAVSDVYQDLFGSGSFTGKGIYDIDAFESATGHTFPENQILSHDLIEGNYARCGLVTDIELFDDFPSRYHAYARREHRWVRGDWQLLPWLKRTVPVESGTKRNPLPLLERWKVLDNLRRSVVPPALVIWLVLGWTVLPIPWWLTMGLAVVVMLLPFLLHALGTVVSAVRGLSLNPVREFRTSGPLTLTQVGLSATFLLNQAYLSVDAIVRTFYRTNVTRRNLLEWETAAAAERRLGERLIDFGRAMWQSVFLGIVLVGLVGVTHPNMLIPAGVFLAAWILSPIVAYRFSKPSASGESPMTVADRRELRRIARRTWGFFETFVGPEDHWLPPDNFQEEPRGQVAHRTSPTNQGLLLLSTLSAHDFGYVGLMELATRLEETFDTLDRLERHRGHFLNWYDTRTLETLQPAYVSTVDSGNLLGCLLTLKQGVIEKTREPIIGPAVAEGFADTLAVLIESLPTGVGAMKLHGELGTVVEELSRFLHDVPGDLLQWRGFLSTVVTLADTLGGWEDEQTGVWATRLASSARAKLDELNGLVPWLSLLDESVGRNVTSRLPGWSAVQLRLLSIPLLGELAIGREALGRAVSESVGSATLDAEELRWVRRLGESVARPTGDLVARFRRIAERVDAMVAPMDFRFLYKPERHLFAIGYNVAMGRFDAGNYDLLASEARLASFLSVARGDAPPKHWFHLGRLVVRIDARLCLMSWGGTMFEYLMPELLLRRYPGTLLAESCEAAVARQMSYGHERGVPWGISESAFSSRYVNMDHQYQAFGVPGLGLKRGLGEDLVIAPYATALAAMVRPHDALENFRRLAAEGAYGRYGFYEAVDFTRERLPEGRRSMIVRCYMAHHQGMSLIALANCLFDDPMPRRFHSDPVVRATELLLQERVPTTVNPLEPHGHDASPRPAEGGGALSRRLTTPNSATPRTHLLSNGRYSVMVTNGGGSASRCEGLDVSRWREDTTRDDWGQFCYVRDILTGLVWSAGHQPICRTAEFFEVIYSADKAEFRRLDGGVATHLEITVCPENRAEVRRVTIANQDDQFHEVELTSYLEPVLLVPSADRSHLVFGKLFMETEWVPAHGALLCRRRPREVEQKPIWAIHAVGGDGEPDSPQFETDRARFVGRGRTTASPAALDPGASLSNTAGAVLDPVLCLRRRFRLRPGETATVTFCTAIADSRAEALALADHYRDPQAALRVFDLAWAHSQIEMGHLRITAEDAHLYQRLAAPLIYTGTSLRHSSEVLARNRQGQQGLWRHGISGDRPILLARVADSEEMPLVRQLLAAHAFWRLRGLEVDIVLLCDQVTGYFEELFHELLQALRGSESHLLADRPGGVFIRKADHITEEDKLLLQAYARVSLAGYRGSLAAQIGRVESAPLLPLPPSPILRLDHPDPLRLPHDLLFNNGLGGFTRDGCEYCVLPYSFADGSMRYAPPPAPWVNVIANPALGFIVSESSLGYTWSGNSQMNRLTPWGNDPVSDSPGEAIYLRDSDTGDLWSPTPLPLGGAAPTLVRHGQGYTRFERRGEGLAQEVLLFVAMRDPVKLIVVRVRNDGTDTRRLSATFYAEWVLGTTRDRAPLGVRTSIDAESGTLFAENPLTEEFASQVAFIDVDARPRTFTGDRTEFLGRNGGVDSPAGLAVAGFSERVGAGLDPCAALQTEFELAPGETKELVFILGAAPNAETARRLANEYREPGRASKAFDEVRAYWDRVLGAVQVRTPDPAMDLLVNRWLPYQVLSCRLWGRSGFYQSGGAYGFRDQLQDVMALVYGAPELAREHILRAAARQFLEGDVQHWWHPPGGRGVRTHFSDDFLWLPFVVRHYVTVTGDSSVLDETVAWLRASKLEPHQEASYGLPEVTEEVGTIYEHCVRALRNGLKFGVHGLPLMGCGDWNDGMNRVGSGGRGETVWGAWFLLTCLSEFADLADARSDSDWATSCREHAEELRKSIEANAWDGEWYRRAYFDDGTPLGTAEADECRIDSIAQSWSAISGAGDPDRAKRAMEAVNRQLVRPVAGLVLLFDPPFDDGPMQPGYIKGYLPGVRENGGQYTHAATWVVQAMALLGDGKRASDLFGMINPIRHATTPEEVAVYKVEPYVVAADVYSASPHTGRGGWTWYTGSASWMYRVAIESLLGFRLMGDRVAFSPCVPPEWPGFDLTFRYRSAMYHVVVEQTASETAWRVVLDGEPIDGGIVPLSDDGRTHEVKVSR